MRRSGDLSTAAQPALRAGGTALAVTAHGLIADWRDWDPRGRDRIALPDPVHGLTFVPALGFSDLEPLASGWLVRPRAGQEPVRVVLDLPRIHVAWSTGTWEHLITQQRFVDVLRVLPHGDQPSLTVDELRAKLPGDPGGKSNIYKIMSLLRREFGGLLDPWAYRFAGHVVVDVLH
jgi:hypothetical protein